MKLDLLDETDSKGRPLWLVLEDEEYDLGRGCKVTMPAGVKSNLGTIPRIAYWIISPSDGAEAFVFHDYLCGEEFEGYIPPDSGFSRWMADAICHEMLRDNQNISRLRAFAVFSILRAYAVLWRIK